jgi:subtilisin family serine protease
MCLPHLQDNGVSPTADYKAPDSHLFWQAGLDGKGQIIGIGDSGIDMNSCYFRDPANPFNPSPDSKEWISPNHRKVVYYYGIADTTFRDQVGHGTHTSGSLVGEDPADPTSKATGAAKGAKVAFVDISMQPTQVNAPQELDTEYFPKMYAQGARIFSGGHYFVVWQSVRLRSEALLMISCPRLPRNSS